MKTAFNSILEEVKANHAKLNSCAYHRFSIDLTPAKKIGKQWACENCGGYIDAINKKWYEEGIVHAGRD